MTQNPYDKLRQNAIFTTPKEELTLMLYDGALKFSNQAIAAIESNDLLKANDLILKVENIIREFQLTLNNDYEVSAHLANMYEYIFRILVESNMKKDVVLLGEARDLIREFRDMWKEAIAVSRTAGVK